MSHLTPLAGFAQLRHVPQFIGNLRADLAVLFEPDLPKTLVLRAHGNSHDDALSSAAMTDLMRRHKFAVIRQAARKQLIRESLWPRFCTCWLLAAPITIPVFVLIALVLITLKWPH
jgi:hypothetical protein